MTTNPQQKDGEARPDGLHVEAESVREPAGVAVFIADREDGGARVWSDDMPGLILSGPDRAQVSACIIPAIDTLRGYVDVGPCPLCGGDGKPRNPTNTVCWRCGGLGKDRQYISAAEDDPASAERAQQSDHPREAQRAKPDCEPPPPGGGDLREALKPLAAIGDALMNPPEGRAWFAEIPDGKAIFSFAEFAITAGDLRRAYAALSALPAPVVGEGWVLAPREPTPAMLDAAVSEREAFVAPDIARTTWLAMIGAAPSPDCKRCDGTGKVWTKGLGPDWCPVCGGAGYGGDDPARFLLTVSVSTDGADVQVDHRLGKDNWFAARDAMLAARDFLDRQLTAQERCPARPKSKGNMNDA